jgi:hypothetical protein
MTGPGDPVLHDDYGAEAHYARSAEARASDCPFNARASSGSSSASREPTPSSAGAFPRFPEASCRAPRASALSSRRRGEVLKFIQLVAAGPSAGIEVVKCSPPYDNADITSLMATRVICDTPRLPRPLRPPPRSEGN